ncbi:hypothetical protein [Arthrobacter sp. 31Y]|uniref:hypothetical protein n=1 Tax=Arthrobacter sp. 31Y TaxID=1115632 RepID=UPI00046629D8|nr:hypothetical protein [Arthrobacter sp. 31Y]
MSRATLKWEVAVTVDVEVTDRATALTLLDDDLREAVFAAAYDTVAPVLITVTPVPEDQEFEESFTVIGFWDEDEPVVTGVITGQHSVEGGDGVSEQGPWALWVDAVDAEAAATFAIEEMLETLGGGDE